MSITDIKKLIELIKGADKELNKINEKLFKRVQRIEMMSEGSNIFGDKTDKVTGKLYRASKSYVLFTDLKLPAHLSIDYNKHYRDAFKNNKPKNVLKKVLLSLIDIKSYQ